MRFKDQTIVITGGARGIGFATAARLAGEGAQIVVLDLDGEGAEAAAVKLRDNGVQAQSFALDVSNEAAVNRVFADIEKHCGAIHALINAAAIFPFVPFDEMAIDQWRRVFAVNVEGTLHCSRAAYKVMKREKYGRIINFSTGSFYEGTKNFSAYVASKGAVIGLTRVMATECGPSGVTVNAISPGIMATEGTHSVPGADQFLAWVLQVQQVKRQGQAYDIAEAVIYLASPGASFVTGQTISVDGGVCFR